jgi:hypothetical protein
VLSDSYDPMLVTAIQGRPRTEHPVTRIHLAVREGLGAVYTMDREALLVRVRLALRTPALRARLWENQFATRDLLAGALEDGEPSVATRILASVCLATLTTALEEWVATDGTAELPDLIDDAFRALTEGGHSHDRPSDRGRRAAHAVPRRHDGRRERDLVHGDGRGDLRVLGPERRGKVRHATDPHRAAPRSPGSGGRARSHGQNQTLPCFNAQVSPTTSRNLEASRRTT